MRRLPLLVLLAAAVLLIMRGGFYPPTGFEGAVYNATVAGDSLYSCSLDLERRWAVMDLSKAFNNVYVVKAGEAVYVSGPVRVAEVYYTYVPGDRLAKAWPFAHAALPFWLTDPFFRNPPCRLRPDENVHNYVKVFVGGNTWSTPYFARATIQVGRPICDTRRGLVDEVCSRCQNFVVLNNVVYCADYYRVNVSDVYYIIGARDNYGPIAVNYAVWPNASGHVSVNDISMPVYCSGGTCVFYGDGRIDVNPGCAGAPFCPNNEVGASATWDVTRGGAIPIGLPPAVQPQWSVYNYIPFVISTEDFLQRVTSWSNPYRTVYGKFYVAVCTDNTDYAGGASLAAGYVFTGYSDAPGNVARFKKGTAAGTNKNWVLVPRGQCVVLYEEDLGPIYSVAIGGSMWQEVELTYLMNYVTGDVGRYTVKFDKYAVGALLGQRVPFTVFLPPTPRVEGYGVSVREEVVAEAPIPQWARDALDAPLCPAASGNVWPGIRGGCYGKAVAGVVAHGYGYIVVSYG